jgi:hypothetical protein
MDTGPDSSEPVTVGHLKGTAARPGVQPGGDRSIWGLGNSPVDCGVTDGSVKHDKYFYDVPDD